MAECVLSIVMNVAKVLAVPIWKQICYPFKYNTNMEELNKQAQKLLVQRNMVQSSVDEALQQNLKIHKPVQDWMNRVDDFADSIVQPIIDEQVKAGKLCSFGFCGSLKMRYSLSKKSVKATKDANSLLENGTLFQNQNVAYRPRIQRSKSVYTRGFEDFDSRRRVFEGIMEALAGDNFHSIALHGMGGVGKTTLAKRVAAQAREDKLFENVIVVEVTRKFDLRSIQKKIAEALDFNFHKESPTGRADELHEKLKNVNSILIILDDIWDTFDFDDVGIPFWNDEKSGVAQGDDQEGRHIIKKKRGLLLTSRYQDVLDNMKTRKIFFINTLLEEEAIDLFWKTVNGPKEADFNPIAVEIVKKCAGLPIVITTVASALKNKELYFWKDALQSLRKSNPNIIKGMEANVYSTLRWSYEVLGSEEKSLFLLCGLQDSGFGSTTADLLKYSMGMNLLKDVDTMEDARNRIRALITNLKSSSLLLDGDEKGAVKMHDIIRDVAVSIASSKHMFSFENGDRVKEILEEKLPKGSISVSCRDGDIKELPEMLEFPNLEFFHLSLKHEHSLKIPDALFDNAKELRVLDLTSFNLLSLPSSFSGLRNVQTLCLDDCLIGDIAIIGELKKLEILSLCRSEIEILPREIGQLTRLRWLDLSDCSKLEVIAPNVLSSMTRLEELYMQNSFVQWDVDGQHNACLAELKKLSNLATLEIQVLKAEILPPDLLFGKLKNYKILIGDVWQWSSNYETTRVLKVKLNNSFFLSDEIKFLLNKVEDLHLDEPKGVKNILQELNRQGFQELKHLHVQNAPQIQHISSNSSGWGLCNVFPHKLESLVLQNLINLEKICHGKSEVESFGQLKVIKIGKCDKLKHLKLPMPGHLSQLQEIEVTDCSKLEEIVLVRGRQFLEDTQRIWEFVELRTMALQCLPRLSRFGFITSEDDPDSFRPFLTENVLLPVLENLKLSSMDLGCQWLDQLPALSSCYETLVMLTVEDCSGLQFLFSYPVVKCLRKLKRLEIINCEAMEAIVYTEDSGRNERSIEMIFPSLRSLKLNGLPELKRFGSGHIVEFPVLYKLEIRYCPKMQSFISGSPYENIKTYKEDEEASSCNVICPVLDKKVSMPSLIFLDLRFISSPVLWHNQYLAASLCFRNVTSIWIAGLSNLKYLFTSTVVSSLVQLTSLVIKDCELMEVVVAEEKEPRVVLFPKLDRLFLVDLSKLTRFCDFVGNSTDMSSISKILVRNCPSMKTFISSSHCVNTSVWTESSEIGTQNNIRANVPPLFDEKVKLSNLKELNIQQMGNVERIWHDELYLDSFSRLEFVNVRNCEQLTSVFPSNMFRRLQGLRDLAVIECDSVEQIFELEALDGEKTHDIAAPQLKTMKLDSLPKLEHVWNMDSQVILSSQNLHKFTVRFCHGLKSLFPTVIAKGLEQLVKLLIDDCMMEEIIAKENEVDAVNEFVFSQLKELLLYSLPRLKSFHTGLNISKWPLLEDLTVWDCSGAEKLTSEFQSYKESQHDIPSVQPLFLVDKVAFPNLNQLTLGWNCFMNEMSPKTFSGYMCSLKCLELLGPFMGSAICPFCFLCKFPEVTSIAFYSGYLAHLFLHEGLACKEKHSELPNNLSSLGLHVLEDSSLWAADSVFDRVSRNLETLEVTDCYNITSLVPFTTSFNKLKILEVTYCKGLLNLIAPSTAKSLVHLTRLEITECEKIEVIIWEEEEGVGDFIVFSQLEYLKLYRLPSLSFFYSGNCRIKFPCLQELEVTECPNMERFSRNDLSTPRLHTLHLGELKNAGRWEGDLNSTIEHLYIEKDVQSSQTANDSE